MIPPPFTFNNSQKHHMVLSQYYHIHNTWTLTPLKNRRNSQKLQKCTKPNDKTITKTSQVSYHLSFVLSMFFCLLKVPIEEPLWFQTTINRCNKPHVKTVFKRWATCDPTLWSTKHHTSMMPYRGLLLESTFKGKQWVVVNNQTS